jgi:hypothetical protein
LEDVNVIGASCRCQSKDPTEIVPTKKRKGAEDPRHELLREALQEAIADVGLPTTVRIR